MRIAHDFEISLIFIDCDINLHHNWAIINRRCYNNVITVAKKCSSYGMPGRCGSYAPEQCKELVINYCFCMVDGYTEQKYS